MSITFETTPSNAAASGVFVEAQNVRRSVAGGIIPHKILLLGQYNADKSPDTDAIQQLLSVGDARSRYGNGSMLALMAERAFAVSRGVPIYAAPIADDNSAVTAGGTITLATTATATGVLSLYIAGRRVRATVVEGDTAAEAAATVRDAINANANLPVVASIETGQPAVVVVAAKWGGATGNQILIEQNLDSGDAALMPGGTTATIAAMSGGLNDPDIAEALAIMGDEFYTVIANPYDGSDAYDALRLKGNELFTPEQKRPFIAFVGSVRDYADTLTFIDGRNSQWYSVVTVPDSASIPFEIAASMAGAVAWQAQMDPARPTRTLELIGIYRAREQWTYSMRNAVVLAGGGTTKTDSTGIVTIEDAVTSLTEIGDEPDEAYRFVETITNLQNKIYQLDRLFSGRPFSQSIIVDDDSTTGKEYAIRPKTVKAYAIAMVDEWILQAWSKNRTEIVAGIEAQISESNPNRIDVLIPDVFSAGGKVFAVKLEWAFVPPQIS